LARLVRDALARLYDPVFLQTHPLGRALGLPPGGGRGEPGAALVGRVLRHRLLDAIRRLRPEGKAGEAAVGAWRRHRLLELRYVEALDPPTVRTQLGIEKSQYYREHARALAAVVAVLAGDPRTAGAAGAEAGTGVLAGAAPGPGAAPTTREPMARPTNLPRQLTSFVGRAREIEDVRRLLAASALVTLTGTGGVGKTRLALQAMTGRPDASGRPNEPPGGTLYPDGVVFVDLAPLAPGAGTALVASAALAAAGAREAPGQPAAEALVAHLQQRRVLLLLDNCEHVLQSCAPLAAAVLQGCPGVRVLATSREPLGVPGETVWRVPSLALPGQAGADGAPASTGRALERSEAVRLFVERAVAAEPDFRLTDDNGAHVAEVCRRLDGIPLALELAAARVRVLSVEQLAARLDDRFRLLTGGGRTALPRQQTLQTTVDWSHDLLSVPERALFRRLAVFAGGFSLAGAESVCPGGAIEATEVLDLVTALVDKSLVVAESGGPDRRYRLPETMRQYAAEKLALAGEEAALRDRHLGWCVALARGASEAERSRDPERHQEARRRYVAEWDNVRAALAWGAATPDGAARALDILSSVILTPRPSQAEKARWLETLLAASPARTAVRARALLTLDFLRRLHHDFAGARVAVEEARAIAIELGDEDLATRAAESGALIAANLGQYAVAVEALEGCLALARGRDSWVWVEGFTRDLGGVLLAMGDFERARALLAESRDVGFSHDSRYSLRPRLFLSIIDRLTGDLRGARAALEALGAEADAWDAAGRQLDRFNFREPARWALANLARDEGQYGEAQRLLAGSLEDLSRLGEVGQLLAPTCMAGLLAIAAGDTSRGVALVAACAPPAGPVGTVHVPELRVEVPVFLARARAALGGAAYEAAWERGRRMTLQEAADLARAEAVPRPEARRPAIGPLSPREAQVAALVARGLTNREIAAALLFTEHTAMRHVEHILGKLGLRNRAQITAWAVVHGVADGAPAG
jgi:non-specific serine/threonine protein kinase